MNHPFKNNRTYLHLRNFQREISTYINGITASGIEPNSFIIFAQGRTGSTMLVDLLGNSKDIFVDGEVFGSSMPRNVLFKKFYLKSLASIKGKEKQYYGYRIKIYELYQIQHFTPDKAIAFVRSLIAGGARVIYLQRSNKFRQVLSSLVAEARNQYHLEREGKADKVFIDTNVIKTRIAHLQDFTNQEMAALKDMTYLTINYENDLLNAEMHQNVADRISSFLNISPFRAETRYARTSSHNFAEFILNHEEVAALAHELGYD